MTETAETTEPASRTPELRRDAGPSLAAVRRAVILAAGRGDRLQPLTNELKLEPTATLLNWNENHYFSN